MRERERGGAGRKCVFKTIQADGGLVQCCSKHLSAMLAPPPYCCPYPCPYCTLPPSLGAVWRVCLSVVPQLSICLPWLRQLSIDLPRQRGTKVDRESAEVDEILQRGRCARGHQQVRARLRVVPQHLSAGWGAFSEDAACPVGTGRGTRRVQSVLGQGRVVSSQYGGPRLRRAHRDRRGHASAR